MKGVSGVWNAVFGVGKWQTRRMSTTIWQGRQTLAVKTKMEDVADVNKTAGLP